MPNISDRELDKLFQDAGQELRPDYNPKDWEDMAKRLEKAERRAILKRAGGYGLGVLLLISSVAWLPESNATRPVQSQAQALTLPAETASTIQPETASPTDAATTLSQNTTGTTAVPSHTGTGTSAQSISAIADHNYASSINTPTTTNANTTQPTTTTPSTPHAGATQNENVHAITETHNNAEDKKTQRTAVYEQHSITSVTHASDSPNKTVTTKNAAANKQNTTTQQAVVYSTTASTPATVATSTATTQGVTAATTSTEKAEAQTGHSQTTAQTSAATQSLNNEQADNTRTSRKDNGAKTTAVESVAITNDQPNSTQQPTDTVATTTQRNTAPVNNNSSVSVQPSATDNARQLAVTNNTRETTPGTTNNNTHNADSTVTPVQDSVAIAVTEAKTDSAARQTPEEKKTPYRAKWFIKMPVSPDFSAIDYGKPGKAGINIGLMAEFMPTRHWSVSAGAIWSKKIYTSDSPDKTYGSNGGYGNSGYGTTKASFLSGDCRVVDIPLNITYYLRPEARTNFFVSAGFSSYIMLLEMYTYTVEANQQEYKYDERYVCKNKNWFSMLNLSFGIQHRLSNRFQIQAEPFLKAPVSGIGQGKVNLNTMGAFFTLKLQLNN